MAKLRGPAQRSWRRAACAGALALALPGCATIRGAQDSLPELRPSAQAEPMKAAVRNFYSPHASDRGGLSPVAYRNSVIRDYSQRIEARYRDFVDQLYSGDRSSALAFDFLQLGIGAATGLVEQSAVEELAVAATVTAGARATIDKRLFYDRTITALVTSMDAERTNIKAEIARKRRLSEFEYTLDDAFDDLNLLADAGSLNRALSQINRNAETDREEARAAYNRSLGFACDATQEIIPLRQQVGDQLLAAYNAAQTPGDASAAAAGRLRMESIAFAFDVPATGDNDALRDAVLDKIELDYCSADALRARIDRLLP
ncbi:MAG TPA: hypothetical protein VEB68_00640 [Croceibacterium sp.]|nr:hypothetical protein [Croceibacterium sp.]